GLGSGGSTVALELAKAGVGAMILCDPDVVEDANVVRHECDDRHLGWTKARAVADLALRRNPQIDVRIVERRVEEVEGDLPEILATVDLLAVCTDTQASRHLLNQHATAS